MGAVAKITGSGLVQIQGVYQRLSVTLKYAAQITFFALKTTQTIPKNLFSRMNISRNYFFTLFLQQYVLYLVRHPTEAGFKLGFSPFRTI